MVVVVGPAFPLTTTSRQLLGGRVHGFKFDPFADDHEGNTEYLIGHMLNILDLDNPPAKVYYKSGPVVHNGPSLAWPRRRVVEPPVSRPLPIGSGRPQPSQTALQHPRPVRAIAMRDALQRFEHEAQFAANESDCSSSSPFSVSLVSATRGLEDAAYLDDADNETMARTSPQPSSLDHISLMSRGLTKAWENGNMCSHSLIPFLLDAKSSGGLVCSSLSALECFSGRARQREQSPVQKNSPVLRVSSTSGSLQNSLEEDECVPEAMQMTGEAADDDLKRSVCQVEEERDDSEEEGAKAVFPDVKSYDTTDELSYDDEVGYNSDDEGAEDIESPCASPQPASSSSTPSVRLVTSASTSSLGSTVFEPLPLADIFFKAMRSSSPESWSTLFFKEIEVFN